MSLLLDTRANIWFSENDPRLSADARIAIELLGNAKYIRIYLLAIVGCILLLAGTP